MSKLIQSKIAAITHESDRAAIMDLHDKLTAEQDKAQNKYDEAMANIEALRSELDERSNLTGDE